MLRSFLLAALTAGLAANAAADEMTDFRTAEAHLRAERWTEAEPILDRLIDANPAQGGYWHYRAVARAGSGRCDAARPDFAQAIALGSFGDDFWVRHALIEDAACASLSGATGQALARIATARDRYKLTEFSRIDEDDRFAAVHELADYARLAGRLTGPALSRDEGWRHDLDWYVDLVLARHPDPFHTTSETVWRSEVDRLRRDIPGKSDVEIASGFMRLASMIGDGHTSIYPPFEGPLAFSLTPIWPYKLDGEWTILAAAPEQGDLVGARIIEIEGRPIAEAEAQIAAHMPRDNAMTFDWIGAYALQFTDIGAGMFGAPDAGRIRLAVIDAQGERHDLVLDGGPFDRDISARWAPAGWPSLGSQTPPLWLSGLDRTFWSADLPELGAVYAQLNQIRDGEEMSMAEFAAGLVVRMEQTGAERLILDLRHNNGGNGDLNWGFVRALLRSEAIDRPGGLYVITGRRTFSAAQLLSNMLEAHTDAVFVGEATGSSPAFYGEDTQFRLPWSGLQGSISSRWFQNRFILDDDRPWIAPDLAAPLTRAHVEDGRDPALEAIVRRLEATR